MDLSLQSVCTWSLRPREAAPAGLRARLEQQIIDARDERLQFALVGRLDDQHAAAFFRREASIVQIITIHRHE